MAHHQQPSSFTVERVRGPWSPEEDARLRFMVKENGPYNWSNIASFIPGRTAKSCRLRWCNQLSPTLVHAPFSQEEDEMIVNAHKQYGNKWATIARHFVGRSDNAVKNRWHATLKRKLLRGGLLRRNNVPNGNPAMVEHPMTLKGYNLDPNGNLEFAAPPLTFLGYNVVPNGNDAMVVPPVTYHGLNAVPDWNASMVAPPLTNEQMYAPMTANISRMMQDGTVSTELSLFASGVEREMGEAAVAMASAQPAPAEGDDWIIRELMRNDMGGWSREDGCPSTNIHNLGF